MADIAFLLLIFFLVTTTIVSDKGIPFILPPKVDENVPVDVADKNVFKVLVNSNNDLLVEDQPMELSVLRENAVEFLSNNGKDPSLSDSPEDAIISYRADRGTNYETFITILDELKAAYHVLRAQELGITVERYLELDAANPNQKKALEAARQIYPMQLSIAEPTKFGE